MTLGNVITYDNGLSDDVKPVYVLSSGSDINAGTFGYTATSLTNDNYILPASKVSPIYTINKRTVDIEWLLEGSNTNYSTEYSGVNKIVTANITNPVPGDSVSLMLTFSSGNIQNVGTFTYRATSLLGTKSANYQLPATEIGRAHV